MLQVVGKAKGVVALPCRVPAMDAQQLVTLQSTRYRCTRHRCTWQRLTVMRLPLLTTVSLLGPMAAAELGVGG